MRRLIIYAASCDEAAARLGGYQAIDLALDAAIQGLIVNPYDHRLIETDFYRIRYLITRPIGAVPALVWLFQIDDENNVVLTHVEESETY